METQCKVTRSYLVDTLTVLTVPPTSILYEAEIEELDGLIYTRLKHLSADREVQLLRAFCLFEWLIQVSSGRLATGRPKLLALSGPKVCRSYGGLSTLMAYLDTEIQASELVEADNLLSGQVTAAGSVPVFRGSDEGFQSVNTLAMLESLYRMARLLRHGLNSNLAPIGQVSTETVSMLGKLGLLSTKAMVPARALFEITGRNCYALCPPSTVSQV